MRVKQSLVIAVMILSAMAGSPCGGQTSRPATTKAARTYPVYVAQLKVLLKSVRKIISPGGGADCIQGGEPIRDEIDADLELLEGHEAKALATLKIVPNKEAKWEGIVNLAACCAWRGDWRGAFHLADLIPDDAEVSSDGAKARAYGLIATIAYQTGDRRIMNETAEACSKLISAADPKVDDAKVLRHRKDLEMKTKVLKAAALGVAPVIDRGFFPADPVVKGVAVTGKGIELFFKQREAEHDVLLDAASQQAMRDVAAEQSAGQKHVLELLAVAQLQSNVRDVEGVRDTLDRISPIWDYLDAEQRTGYINVLLSIGDFGTAVGRAKALADAQEEVSTLWACAQAAVSAHSRAGFDFTLSSLLPAVDEHAANLQVAEGLNSRMKDLMRDWGNERPAQAISLMQHVFDVLLKRYGQLMTDATIPKPVIPATPQSITSRSAHHEAAGQKQEIAEMAWVNLLADNLVSEALEMEMQGQHELARDWGRKGSDLKVSCLAYGQLPQGKDAAQGLIKIAAQQAQLGDFDGAISTSRSALAFWPDDSVREALLENLLGAGQVQEAVVVETGMSKHDAKVMALGRIAAAQAGAGDFVSAMSTVQVVAGMDPSASLVDHVRGMTAAAYAGARLKAGNTKEAWMHAAEALEPAQAGGDQPVVESALKIMILSGDLDGALTQVKKIYGKKGTAAVLSHIAPRLVDAGAYAEALALLGHISEQPKIDSMIDCAAAAEARLAPGQVKDPAAFFRTVFTALSAAPERVDAIWEVARSFTRRMELMGDEQGAEALRRGCAWVLYQHHHDDEDAQFWKDYFDACMVQEGPGCALTLAKTVAVGDIKEELLLAMARSVLDDFYKRGQVMPVEASKLTVSGPPQVQMLWMTRRLQH